MQIKNHHLEDNIINPPKNKIRSYYKKLNKCKNFLATNAQTFLMESLHYSSLDRGRWSCTTSRWPARSNGCKHHVIFFFNIRHIKHTLKLDNCERKKGRRNSQSNENFERVIDTPLCSSECTNHDYTNRKTASTKTHHT